MNSVQSVQDANTALPPQPHPAGQDDAPVTPRGSMGPMTQMPAQTPRPQKAVQDIQDIIDKLAAVTQQLRHPRRG